MIYGRGCMKRRDLLKLGAVTAAGSGLLPRGSAAEVRTADAPLDETTLGPLAEAVLPDALGAEGRTAAILDFLGWVRNFQTGQDLENGYGHTRLARTGANPGTEYRAQLQALDASARGQHGRPFSGLDLAARRGLVADVFRSLKIKTIGERPTGRHVAADLMGHYFWSNEANDLCYEAAIGRDSCRSLEGSGDRPDPLSGQGVS